MRQRLYDAQQRERRWLEHSHRVERGRGRLAWRARHRQPKRCSDRIQGRGRSRKPRHFPASRHLRPQGSSLFGQSEISFACWPATPATARIIQSRFAAQLARHGALQGAYLINAGARAAVDTDPGPLEEGSLTARSSMFRPSRPIESPLWGHPKVSDHPAQCRAGCATLR